MLTKEQWLEQCAELIEPSVGVNLVEYQLIRDVMIQKDRIAMTVILSERTDEIEAHVREQIKTIAESTYQTDVHVRFRELTDAERTELLAKLNEIF